MSFAAALVLLVVGLLLVFLTVGPLHIVGIVLAIVGGIVLLVALVDGRARL